MQSLSMQPDHHILMGDHFTKISCGGLPTSKECANFSTEPEDEGHENTGESHLAEWTPVL